MTATIEIELQQELLEFLERYSQERRIRRDEIIAQGLRLLHAEWELEKGYLSDKEETLAFAEAALPIFSSGERNGSSQTW
jgi:metal-responsive CopG/Arc/MetJ family transcriptional regulator